jgi:hypothetical protein
MRTLLAATALLLFVIPPAWATPISKQIPMTFQTKLPPGDSYNFNFSLHDGPGDDAVRVWSEGPVSIRVLPEMTISHRLGSIRPFSKAVDFSQQLWVQWSAGGQSQRKKLGVVPYAMFSITPGPEGPPGEQGPPGNDGLACYDLNGNGKCDLDAEDKNGSGGCSAEDCQGPKGDMGDPGPFGIAEILAFSSNVNQVCNLRGVTQMLSDGTAPILLVTGEGQGISAILAGNVNYSCNSGVNVGLCYRPSSSTDTPTWITNHHVYAQSDYSTTLAGTVIPGPGSWDIGVCTTCNACDLPSIQVGWNLQGWIMVTNK